MDADCLDHATGPLCDPSSGGCTTLCRADADCDVDAWCNAASESLGHCVSKLDNGAALPAEPMEVASCTALVGERVCRSGVCDLVDQACGYADGNGPCTEDAECRNQSCNAEGICTNDCTNDDQCPVTQYCDATGGCTTKRIDGQPCDRAGQCVVGLCDAAVCGGPYSGMVAGGGGFGCRCNVGMQSGLAGLGVLWLLFRRRKRTLT